MVDRDWILSELRASLRALAAGGSRALASVPGRCVKADELALDFDNFVTAALENCPREFTPSQRAALESVKRHLEIMSGQRMPELWTDEAVCVHEEWTTVRGISRQAVQLLGWAEVSDGMM